MLLAMDGFTAAEIATERREADLDATLAAANRELLDYIRARIGTRSRPRPQTGRPATAHRHGGQACGCEEDLDLALELSLQLTRALDLSLDLALAVPAGGRFDHARALTRALSANLAAARDFEPDADTDAGLEFALDPGSGPEAAARVAGRSRMLDFARLIAHRLARELADAAEEAAALARTAEWMLDRAHDLELGRAIAGRIDGITYIDASGADLSRLQLCAAAVPIGTRWSDRTVWPACIAADIRALSREVRPGTYLVDAPLV